MTTGALVPLLVGVLVGAVVLGVVIRVALEPVLAELRSIRCDLLLPLLVAVRTLPAQQALADRTTLGTGVPGEPGGRGSP